MPPCTPEWGQLWYKAVEAFVMMTIALSLGAVFLAWWRRQLRKDD